MGTKHTDNRRGLTFDIGSMSPRMRTLVLACILFWSVLCYLGLTRFVVMSVDVSGDSMVPTLRDGERRFMHRWRHLILAPQRGELVAIEQPDYEFFSVKRVIALPHERVQVKYGRVYVNGEPLNEPYLPDGTVTTGGALGRAAFRVADECYFVLGDNRRFSVDSRDHGAVHRDEILGAIFP